jgi:hypothetical protein
MCVQRSKMQDAFDVSAKNYAISLTCAQIYHATGVRWSSNRRTGHAASRHEK